MFQIFNKKLCPNCVYPWYFVNLLHILSPDKSVLRCFFSCVYVEWHKVLPGDIFEVQYIMTINY